jgi:hypothetical protein
MAKLSVITSELSVRCKGCFLKQTLRLLLHQGSASQSSSFETLIVDFGDKG